MICLVGPIVGVVLVETELRYRISSTSMTLSGILLAPAGHAVRLSVQVKIVWEKERVMVGHCFVRRDHRRRSRQAFVLATPRFSH